MTRYREIENFHTYTPDPRMPPAFIADIDGTVALRGDRSPYDESKVHLDVPNAPVVTAVRSLLSVGVMPIFTSGRTGDCFDATHAWLVEWVLGKPWASYADGLYMRKPGDTRPDYVIKHEMFWEFIGYKWNVQFVFDDRNQVVDMWRAMGLSCFQVAPGDF